VRQKETFVKDLFVVSVATFETFPFKSPCKMGDHESRANVINWSVGHTVYKELHTVITEAVASFAYRNVHSSQD